MHGYLNGCWTASISSAVDLCVCGQSRCYFEGCWSTLHFLLSFSLARRVPLSRASSRSHFSRPARLASRSVLPGEIGRNLRSESHLPHRPDQPIAQCPYATSGLQTPRGGSFDPTADGPPQTRRGHSRRWTAALCAVLAFLIPAKELRGSHGAFQVTQATPERAGWTSLGALRLRSPASGTLRVRAHSRVSPSHQRRRGRSKFFSGPACTVLQNHRKVGPGACYGRLSF